MDNVVDNVFPLAEYRRRREAKSTPPASSPPGPQYSCTRCDSDHFKLYTSGRVHCASCGALIRNVAVKV